MCELILTSGLNVCTYVKRPCRTLTVEQHVRQHTLLNLLQTLQLSFWLMADFHGQQQQQQQLQQQQLQQQQQL